MQSKKLYEGKIYRDIDRLINIVEQLRTEGHKIVLVSGTFDLLHVGHNRYLAIAAEYGDYLIVGVDSDEKVKARKGPHRPVVDEDERSEMLTYLESVDFIYVKPLSDPHWTLIKTVKPDVLIISERSGYSPEEVDQLSDLCGEVVELDSQAETSTTARIRTLIISNVAPLQEKLTEVKMKLQDMENALDKILGGK